MKVLSGPALATKVREICHRSGTRELAVAFWGPSIRAELFPAGLEGVEIVLDVGMGGTSKKALEALGVPHATNVWVCEGLHTKLYIGVAGAIIASANASLNALGRNLEGGSLQELGVWVDASADKVAFDAARREFQRLKKLSHRASQCDIDRAPEHVARQVAWEPRVLDPNSFLALVASDPHRFQNSLFIFGDADISAAEHAEKEKALRHLASAEGAFNQQLDDIMMYHSTESERIDRADAHRFIVMFYWGDSARTPTLHAFDNVRRLPVGEFGNSHYQGQDSWKRYCHVNRLPASLHDQHSVEQREAPTAAKLRGRGPRGNRWREYTAFDIADVLAAANE
jgi:hypothetical protein